MSHDTLQTYQSQLKSIKIPVVDQEWISQCFLNGKYLQPERYSIIPGQLSNIDKDSFKISLESLDSLMEKVDSSERMMNYLMNCVVYISRMDDKEERIQQRLIHLGGGAHIMTIIPNITHIISDQYSEDQAKEFNKFTNVFIVGTRWLKDCMRFRTRVPEIEYIIKPSKKSDMTNLYKFCLLRQLDKTTSNQTLGVQRLSESNRDYSYALGKRMSDVDNPMKGDKKTLGQKRLQQPESELFKDVHYPFYFDGSVQDKLKPIMQKVFFNSGSAVANLEVIKSKQFDPKAVYCIIPDGRPDLIRSIKEQIGDKALFLSPRWITYCIERHSVISYNQLKERAMVSLLPIDLPTPFTGLEEIKVTVMKNHFDMDREFTLDQLVQVLGFSHVSSLAKM